MEAEAAPDRGPVAQGGAVAEGEDGGSAMARDFCRDRRVGEGETGFGGRRNWEGA